MSNNEIFPTMRRKIDRTNIFINLWLVKYETLVNTGTYNNDYQGYY